MCIKSHRSSPRVLRHPVPIIQILAQMIRFLLVQQIGISNVCSARNRQKPVHDYISVPTDGRREMRVEGYSETVMEIVLLLEHPAGEVDSLHHATRRQDSQHGVHIRVVFFDCRVKRCGQIFACVGFYLKALRRQ